MNPSKYHFTVNPFSEERHDFPMVGRSDNWKDIQRTLTNHCDISSHGIMTIFGAYGIGKTFTLKCLEREINNKPDFVKPKGKVLAIFLKIVETKIPSQYLSNLLTRIIKNIGKENLLQLVNANSLEEIQFNTPMGNVLQNLEQPEAWKWLTAKSITPSEMKSIGADYKITDPDESLSLFEDFLLVLKSANYSNLVLLLDELEYLMAKGGREKILQTVHEIQLLWDHYNELEPTERQKICNVVFVLACSVDSWQKFLDMAEKEHKRTGGAGTETFLRRVKGKITLNPLNTPQVKQFFIQRLDAYRDQKTGKIEPFEDDYVKFLSEVSSGIPSKILNYSELILDEALKAKLTTIDRQFGEKVLLEHGLLEEFEEVIST